MNKIVNKKNMMNKNLNKNYIKMISVLENIRNLKLL